MGLVRGGYAMKAAFKAIADLTASVLVFPAYLAYQAGQAVLGPAKAFAG
jgi:hypothetical protein